MLPLVTAVAVAAGQRPAGTPTKLGEPPMPKKEMPTLGELEARVLQLVWDRQPCTERHGTGQE